MSMSRIEQDVVRIKVPGLHGPKHDWFVIATWLDEALHKHGIEHTHWTEEDE